MEKAHSEGNTTGKKERGVKVGLERFEKILRLARRRTGVTMEELKRELEVSQASVKRDIEFLRSRMGCTIDWDFQEHRYFVRDLPDGGRFERKRSANDTLAPSMTAC